MPVKTGGLGHPYVPLPFNSIVCKTVLVKDTNVIKHPIYYTESSLQHRNLKLLFLAWGGGSFSQRYLVNILSPKARSVWPQSLCYVQYTWLVLFNSVQEEKVSFRTWGPVTEEMWLLEVAQKLWPLKGLIAKLSFSNGIKYRWVILSPVILT